MKQYLSNKLGSNSDIFIAIASFILITLLSNQAQDLITYNSGKGWDGEFYYQIAEQIQSGQIPTGIAPFVFRVGVPLIVALLFNNNLLIGFLSINLFANLIAVVLLLWWFRLYIKNWKIRVSLVLLFLTQWHSPVRFVHYYPVYVDPWLFVFLIGGLIGIKKIARNRKFTNILLFGLFIFVGVMFREVVIIIPIALLIALNPIGFKWIKNLRSGNNINSGSSKNLSIQLVIPLLFAFVSFSIIRTYVVETNEYSFLLTALDWLTKKPILSYIHAYFIALGPAIIVLLVFYWRRVGSFLFDHQFILLYILCIVILGWVGGSDTERIIYWSMPVIYLILGILIEENSDILLGMPLVILMIFQLLSQRLFWIVPDYPNEYSTPFPFLTILSNKFQYLDLYSFHGNQYIQMISLIQYSILFFILLSWLKYHSRKKRIKLNNK